MRIFPKGGQAWSKTTANAYGNDWVRSHTPAQQTTRGL